jgi:hypothetical protein
VPRQLAFGVVVLMVSCAHASVTTTASERSVERDPGSALPASLREFVSAMTADRWDRVASFICPESLARLREEVLSALRDIPEADREQVERMFGVDSIRDLEILTPAALFTLLYSRISIGAAMASAFRDAVIVGQVGQTDRRHLVVRLDSQARHGDVLSVVEVHRQQGEWRFELEQAAWHDPADRETEPLDEASAFLVGESGGAPRRDRSPTEYRKDAPLEMLIASYIDAVRGGQWDRSLAMFDSTQALAIHKRLIDAAGRSNSAGVPPQALLSMFGVADVSELEGLSSGEGLRRLARHWVAVEKPLRPVRAAQRVWIVGAVVEGQLAHVVVGAVRKTPRRNVNSYAVISARNDRGKWLLSLPAELESFAVYFAERTLRESRDEAAQIGPALDGPRKTLLRALRGLVRLNKGQGDVEWVAAQLRAAIEDRSNNDVVLRVSPMCGLLGASEEENERRCHLFKIHWRRSKSLDDAGKKDEGSAEFYRAVVSAPHTANLQLQGHIFSLSEPEKLIDFIKAARPK